MNNNEIRDITSIEDKNINLQPTNIEPISKVNPIQNSEQPQIPITNINMQESTDEFAHGLPEWDLIPPYTTVRRVNRK